MTNEQLVIQIKARERVRENMLQLWQQVRPFIHMQAKRYQGMIDSEDLEQEGYLALYPAIEGYDPDKGLKFLTYAKYYIDRAMHRYILANKASLRLSYHSHELISKYKRFYNLFLMQYGQHPPDEYAARYLHLTQKQIGEIKRNMFFTSVDSLDAELPGSEDLTVGDTIPCAVDLESDAADSFDRELLKSLLWSMVDRLPDRQPAVIRMKYQQSMTLKEIGETYGVTIEAIRQSERKGIQSLRRSRGARQLKAFLPESIETQAYKGNSADQFNRTWTSSTERTALQLLRM